MKKKVLVISLAVALIALIAGGSLAWFMDTDDVKNVFTVGSVEIEQHEDFVQQSMLIPVVGDNPAADDNYIKKTVTVENVGINDAYVQTFVAVPAVLDNNGILKLYDGDLASKGWTKMDGDANTDGIQPVYTGVTVEGETLPYNVYVYRYNMPLAPELTTAACLEYVYIDKTIDLNAYDLKDAEGNEGTDGVRDTAYFVVNGTEIKDFNAAGELNVYVATQGIQVRGFADAAAAFTAGFADKHPWAE